MCVYVCAYCLICKCEADGQSLLDALISEIHTHTYVFVYEVYLHTYMYAHAYCIHTYVHLKKNVSQIFILLAYVCADTHACMHKRHTRMYA
jgi:hypothetical protein